MSFNTTSSPKLDSPLQTPSLIPGISDPHLALIVPIVIHWLASAVFEVCDRTGWGSQYRLHTSAEELAKNRVTRWECFRVTVQCQGLQLLLGLGLGALGDGDVATTDEEHDLLVYTARVRAVLATIPTLLAVTGIDFQVVAETSPATGLWHTIIGRPEFNMASIETKIGSLIYWYLVPAFQILSALVIADIWMYCLHRLGHTNKWIYKHVHSQHHRLYVPYSWGASYNHPADSILVDGLSYGVACWATGISTRLSIFLFAFASFKNVTDHCGYVFPLNPMRSLTGTDPSFHDVHHQSWGLKTNYGVHFDIWDRIMGTLFDDDEQIAKLRERGRIAAEERLLRDKTLHLTKETGSRSG